MSTQKRTRPRAYRPFVDGLPLEDRLVLSSGGPAQLGAAVIARPQATQNGLSRAELARSYRTQMRLAANEMSRYLNSQIAALYANGAPTAAQLADLKTQIAGAANASTFRVSSQLALLPGTKDRLIAQIQDGQIGSRAGSLVNQINRIIANPRLSQSGTSLAGALTRAINRNALTNAAATDNFLRTTPINALSIDATTGQRIALPQFMAQQVVGQFGNTLGSLAASFPNVVNSALWSGGSISTDAALQQAFATQLNNAVSVAATQLGNNLATFPNSLSLYPGSGTNPIGPVESILYGLSPSTGSGTGTGSTFTSLDAALKSVPTATSADFLSGVNTAFTNTYQGIAGSLGNYFGLATPSAGYTLPTSQFSNMYSPTYAAYGSGFNNGYGSGYIGFGTAPTTVGTAFGTGFNGMVGASSSAIGLGLSGFTGWGSDTITF